MTLFVQDAEEETIVMTLKKNILLKGEKLRKNNFSFAIAILKNEKEKETKFYAKGILSYKEVSCRLEQLDKAIKFLSGK